MTSERNLEEWEETQRKSFKLALSRDFEGSLRLLDDFLEEHRSSNLLSEILTFKAIIREKMGDVQGARSDLLAAYSLSEPGAYRRYAIELTLGRLSDEDSDASSWYLRAVETAALDPLTSGAAAVEGFYRLRPMHAWSAHERELCESALQQAWKLFSLPGRPDLENLPTTLQILSEASTRPLARDQSQ